MPEGFIEPDTISWAATPLDPYSEHQHEVHGQLEQLFAQPYPDDTPQEFSDLVTFDYIAGSARRETVNYSHFMAWQREHPEEAADHGDIIANAQRSGSCPRRLLDFVRNSSVRSTELGKLSLPYGYRLEKLAEFRDEMKDIVAERSGELLVDQPYGHMHVAPHYTDDGKLRGMLATYQRDIGRVLDRNAEIITITERQALAIRIDDASGFPRDLYHDIASRDKKRYEAALARVENEFIQTDAADKFMVPLSLVMFAHRKKPENDSTTEMSEVLRNHMAAVALRKW